ALLTRFLRAEGDPPPESAPSDVHPRFEGWIRMAHAGEWQRLVQALLYDSGLLYREAIEPEGERRVMDFIHLGQNIVREALRENFPLEGLVAWLRQLRAEKPDPEE